VKELVEFLATSLVDNPGDVRVEESQDHKKLQYALSVKQDDLGKVIGKKGRTVKAMRVLLSAFASMQGQEVSLSVIEPERSGEESEQPTPEEQ
jgi:predicted RNA-binding protein YlqC (UPF0109 family)